MDITAKELAAYCGGSVEGDGSATVSDFAKIEEAGKGDLSFIANPKYAHYASTTNASVLLVSKNFEAPSDLKATLVRVEDPYSSLARLMTMVAATKPKPKGIENPVSVGDGTQLPEDIYLGAFAYIGKNVKVGKGVQIYPQCYIGDNCEIGDDTVLYPGVKIYQGCKVGNRCIIHAGAVIGSDGFGFAPVAGHFEKIPQMGAVIIEDDVEIGANTTVDRATFGNTIIGKGTKLDNLIQIAHNVKVGENNVFAAQVGIAGSTKIGDRNKVGGQCGFAGHISIGNDNEIGAQSGLHSDVGNGKRLIGYPAVEAMQFARNAVNMKRLAEFLAAQNRKNK
ncbi:MAG: UDP-3-O-(3-hydroxymyristoyl)glucosamine N-acyltransferase [Muribaculaceae bacterium]|nr:UDP-3-O-(3-hydroxymyristoyl)glucosamine N-acyltransferase [Muribaculaceae bacterium]